MTFVVGTVSERLRDGQNLCKVGQIFDDLSYQGNAGLELFTVAMEAQCCDAALPDYSQIEGPLAVTCRLVLSYKYYALYCMLVLLFFF